MVLELTLGMALEVAGNLSERDRVEISRTWQDLDEWARSRTRLNGVAYGLVHGDTTLAIFGLIFEGPSGTLWAAGREGWQEHIKPLLRMWRSFQPSTLGLELLRCKVYADNPPARRLVEHLGFEAVEMRNGLVQYERSAP